jgi:protein-arginine kinase
MSQDERDKLKEFNISPSNDIFSTAYNLMEDWPEGRAVFYTDDLSLVLKINFEDHLEICFNKGSVNIQKYFKNMF